MSEDYRPNEREQIDNDTDLLLAVIYYQTGNMREAMCKRELLPKIYTTFVMFGTEPQVEILLKKWNYIDQLDETCSGGRTVLMLACIYGQTDIAALLCASGAKVHLADTKG
jgi:ankyrin repeat protein